MVGQPDNRQAALAALGLDTGADIAAIRSAFRSRVKELHPDRQTPTPDSLSQLAEALAAMRTLENCGADVAEVEISANAAAKGLVRVVARIGGNLILRIPAGVEDGNILTAVGSTARVRIHVRRDAERISGSNPAVPPDLPEFVARFAAPSPASRFAGWVRRRPPAA